MVGLTRRAAFGNHLLFLFMYAVASPFKDLGIIPIASAPTEPI
ncbi:hypothetical protein PAEVO_47510 [Paenibacillus sp. GM2FR]|nr:hypothetical protein [Paenibacillus sp. GM2FR]PJN51659.1 hypothetical protein PAEVO_47510 [Paenibacillus sp. GM2FR]